MEGAISISDSCRVFFGRTESALMENNLSIHGKSYKSNMVPKKLEETKCLRAEHLDIMLLSSADNNHRGFLEFEYNKEVFKFSQLSINVPCTQNT